MLEVWGSIPHGSTKFPGTWFRASPSGSASRSARQRSRRLLAILGGAERDVGDRSADIEETPDVFEPALEQVFPLHCRQPRGADAPREATEDELSDVGLAAAQKRGQDDQADARVPRLREAERQKRRLAEEISLVAGDGVPEIVRVSKAVAQEVQIRIGAFYDIAMSLDAGLLQPLRGDALRIEKAQVLAPEGAVRKLLERRAIGELR